MHCRVVGRFRVYLSPNMSSLDEAPVQGIMRTLALEGGGHREEDIPKRKAWVEEVLKDT